MQFSLRFSFAVEVARLRRKSSNRTEVEKYMRSVSVSLGRLIVMTGIVLLGILLMSSLAAAQSTISGQVKDTSGAIMPGVTVEAASEVASGLPRGFRAAGVDGGMESCGCWPTSNAWACWTRWPPVPPARSR